MLCCLPLVDCGGASVASTPAGGGASNRNTGGSSGASCLVGAERCECYRNGTCDAGLTCASGLCVHLAASAGGGTTSTSAVGGSSSTGGGISVVGVGGAVVSAAGGGAIITVGNAGTVSAGGTAWGGTTVTTNHAGRSSTGGAVGNGGVLALTGGTSSTGGAVAPCQGLTGMAGATATCNGTSIEAEPLPVDMIILMDRSVSKGYAVGSDAATSAIAGQTTRWQVLTAAMQALATDATASQIGVSITFFSLNGGTADSPNCDPNQYTTPVVPLGLLGTTGPQIVSAMQALKPAGLTPIVPALTGAFRYAMAEKQKDSTREKVVVLISDGFPTQCTLKSPSDVVDVINEAATAPIPVRTFVIGIGSSTAMTSAKFNLQNYARVGATGKPPFVLDESAGAAAVQEQLVTTLLNISSSSSACDYAVTAPSPAWVIDPTRIGLFYRPNVGALQEIPKVAGASACSASPHGGWYFDDPITPTKITACPCSCAGFGAGTVSLVFGCAPPMAPE